MGKTIKYNNAINDETSSDEENIITLKTAGSCRKRTVPVRFGGSTNSQTSSEGETMTDDSVNDKTYSPEKKKQKVLHTVRPVKKSNLGLESVTLTNFNSEFVQISQETESIAMKFDSPHARNNQSRSETDIPVKKSNLGLESVTLTNCNSEFVEVSQETESVAMNHDSPHSRNNHSPYEADILGKHSVDLTKSIMFLVDTQKQILSRLRVLEQHIIGSRIKSQEIFEPKQNQHTIFLQSIGLPFKDIKKLQHFEESLKNVDTMKTVETSLASIPDSDQIFQSGSTHKILKTFIKEVISDDLLSYYTWTGKSKKEFGRKNSFQKELINIGELLFNVVKAKDERYTKGIFHSQMVNKILKCAYTLRQCTTIDDANNADKSQKVILRDAQKETKYASATNNTDKMSLCEEGCSMNENPSFNVASNSNSNQYQYDKRTNERELDVPHAVTKPPPPMLTQISKKTHLVQTKTRPTSANTQSIAFSNNGKSVYVPLVPVNSKGKTVMNSASCGTRMFQNHKRQQVQTKTYAGQSLIFDYLPGTHQYPRIEIPNNEQHLQDISLQEEMDFPSRERYIGMERDQKKQNLTRLFPENPLSSEIFI